MAVHPSYRLFSAHRRNLVLTETDPVDQQVHEVDRERFGRRLRSATVRLHLVAHAIPEHRFDNVELIPKNMRPHTRTVVRSVDRMRNPSSKNPAIMHSELVGHMTGPFSADRIPDALPPFDATESFMILPGCPRPTHRGDPTNQSRSSRSPLRLINCTSAQFSRWLGVAESRSCQSSAYSRRASTISSIASLKVAPSAATGSPGMKTDQPSPSLTTSALDETMDARKWRMRSPSTKTTCELSRRTVATCPRSAALNNSFRCVRASLKPSA